MAKKKTNNSGGNTATKTKAGKNTGITWVVFLVFLIAVAYVITSLALGMQWNPVAWVKRDTAQSEPGDDVGELTPGAYAAIDNAGNLMQSGVLYTMPESFAFIGNNTAPATKAATRATTLTSGSSVTITATVTPENATNKRVTWSSDNPGVNVAPLSEGSNIAVVTLISNSSSVFKEKTATITCTSVSNPDAVATCQVSRLATADEIELNYSIDGSLSYGSPNTVSVWTETKGGPCGLSYGEIENVTARIWPSDNVEFFDRVDHYLNLKSFYANNYFEYDSNETILGIQTPYDMFYVDRDLAPHKDEINNAFLCACKDVYGGLTMPVGFVVEADYVFNGVKFGRLDKVGTLYLDFTALWVEVGGVEIGDDIVVTP